MAEPVTVGYKRRKGLPDLLMHNELYAEDANGIPIIPLPASEITVLSQFEAGRHASPSSRFGFWTKTSSVASREGCRLDPKYRWLWDFQQGVVWGTPEHAESLSTVLALAELSKVQKGDLSSEMLLIDLEAVEGRQALIRDDIEMVDTIGSDKVRFQGAELLFSKLEPYLCKFIIDPPDALGSTEWIGLNRRTDLPLLTIAYLLMLPSLKEAYRRLQSGKRHARLDPAEMLDLRMELPSHDDAISIQQELVRLRASIIDVRRRQIEIRSEMDALYTPPAKRKK